MLIEIGKKMQGGKGAGYERWAKIFNLKEAAKTLNFLTEHGITDYDELVEKAVDAEANFDAHSLCVKQLEGRMAEVAQLKTHIINYSKTRDVYAEYKKSRHKKEFRAEHLDELEKHEAAKAAFEGLNGKPIPKVAQLSEEYAALLHDKAARQRMVENQTAKQNVDRILNIMPPDPEQANQKETGR